MLMEYKRPDPDQLLQLIKEEESRKERKRGYFKIFIGYIAGVGKTYRMLSKARLLKEKGEDVVAGIVETHGRKETEELLKGLEVLPRKEIEYGGILLEELNLDRVLERKPKFVLVDELAHTNAPGSRHAKRYEDVEELIDAGINVYATMNIQHIESMKDVILQITGVEVKETVPDSEIEVADSIELVDLPTEELLQRLEEGKVYIPEKARQAMTQFFKERNLVALRELALRYATRWVENNMRYHLRKDGILGPWDASSKIMACINTRQSSESLIRLTHKFADNLNAEWSAVYVEPSYKVKMKSEEKLQLERNFKLAEELGGKVFRLAGVSISAELLSFAKSKNITLIITGHPQRSRIEEFIEGSVVYEIIREGSPIQVLVVGGGHEVEQKDTIPHIDIQSGSHRKKYEWKPLMISFSSTIVTTAICLIIKPFLDPINIPMLFIIPILFSVLVAGRRAGIVASILSVGFFDFFFIPPNLSFSVFDLRFIPTFLMLFIVGIITSFLADMVKKQVEYTRQREEFITSLYDFSKDLLISQSLNDFLQRSTRYISGLFNYGVVVLLPDAIKNLQIVSRAGDTVPFDDSEMGVANWVFEHQKPAGYGTDTLSSGKWHYLPLRVHDSQLGVLAIAPNEIGLNNEQKHLIEAFTGVFSLGLESYIKPSGK
jgi:two-component system sensor histidine kinase KdpD